MITHILLSVYDYPYMNMYSCMYGYKYMKTHKLCYNYHTW